MSTQRRKKRLADLETLSKTNAQRRAACIEALHRLPLGMTADDIKAVVDKQFPPLMSEIVLAGTRSIIAAIRRPQAVPVDLDRQRARTTRLTEAAREVVQRVQIGGAVVEYLDKMMVGGKRLGDCARADLIREGEQLRLKSQALIDQSSLLLSIAQHLEPNETVRTSGARTAIIGVLRQHFGE
jgi:hypothetical protein